MSKPQSTLWGWSKRHDRALELCRSQYGTCPFGCGKDGAPNCYAHVVGSSGGENYGQCEPGRVTERAEQLALEGSD
jgi:hypothetical protein